MNTETYYEINRRLAEWDPLGIGFPMSKDEYTGYIPKIHKAIICNEDIKGVLLSIQLDDLGLTIDTNNSKLDADLDCLIKDLRVIIIK